MCLISKFRDISFCKVKQRMKSVLCSWLERSLKFLNFSKTCNAPEWRKREMEREGERDGDQV